MSVRIIFTLFLLIIGEALLGQCNPGLPDSDGDGVCDFDDLAPNNPCTADGVVDGIEPSNWLGFADFKDIDGDGIPFTCDDCIDENDNGVCDGDDPTADLKIAFSHKRGYYKNNFRLYIGTNDPNATIRYTLDHSKPTESNGSIYNNSIYITGTTLLRVFAYSGNKATKIYTHSFLFTDDIIASNVMYTYITQDADYGPQMEDALKALPVISLVSNEIGVGNIDTEKETSVEMFWPDDSRGGFMIRSGIQTWGGSPLNPKKAFRLEFKEQYGDKKLEYDIFKPDNYDDTEYLIPPAEEFDKLLLRAGSQDGLNGEFGNENKTQFLRNRFLFDTQIEMGQVNALAIQIEGTGIRTAESFDASADLAPELCITYSTGLCVVAYPCDDGNANTVNDAYNDNCDCVGLNTVVKAKILLEGFYDATSGLMRTKLKENGLLPLNQPYNITPWDYNGIESTNEFPSDAVDWILVMAREANGNILSQKVGFLNSSGDLISSNGDIGVFLDDSFNNFISIHHRSHLAVISANPYTGGIYDFTIAESQATGIEQLKLVSNKYMLYAGDFDGKGIINNVDYNQWRVQNAVLNQYLPIDGDGNGIINAADYNLWIINNAKVGIQMIRY